jgi:ribosomal protein S3
MNIIASFLYERKLRRRSFLRNIAAEIGRFYVEKGQRNFPLEGDKVIYSYARGEIVRLEICNIKYIRGNIEITLCRPGLLIGRHGTNIQALEDYLHKAIKFKKLLIREEEVLSSLLPYVYTDEGEALE